MSTEIINAIVSDRESPNFSQENSLKEWIEVKAKQHKLNYLLAHAEDGVIWGRFDNERLITSGDIFPGFAKLRSQTLQQCRIFGSDCEVMLWKVRETWKSRSITDANNPDCLPDEDQILWGTQSEKEERGFTLVSDGSEGLKHVVPLANISFDQSKKLYRPLRLTVRHYLDEDKDTGVVRVYLSRLVNLFDSTKKKEANRV